MLIIDVVVDNVVVNVSISWVKDGELFYFIGIIVVLGFK